MKNKLLALIITSIVVVSSCSSSQDSNTTSVSSAETDTELTVFAYYPKFEIPKVESFLDSTLKQKVSLGKDLDMPIQLNSRDKVTLKSTEGHFEIIYSKKDSTSEGYALVKKIGDDLGKKLMPPLVKASSDKR